MMGIGVWELVIVGALVLSAMVGVAVVAAVAIFAVKMANSRGATVVDGSAVEPKPGKPPEMPVS